MAIRRQRRNVQKRIIRALLSGKTIICEKTKARASGGKMLVSIGRRINAVKGGLPFCFITTGRYPESNRDFGWATAHAAAQALISFVGRDIAWAAVNSQIIKV